MYFYSFIATKFGFHNDTEYIAAFFDKSKVDKGLVLYSNTEIDQPYEGFPRYEQFSSIKIKNNLYHSGLLEKDDY